MHSLKTRAIVLKRMDLGEADRLLTVFTDDHGKLRALNKGARKPLSKLAGHLEPFTLVDCQLQEGRNFYTITAADCLNPYIAIRNDLGKTSQAYYLLEMVDALTYDGEAQPVLFDLLQEALTQLADTYSLLITQLLMSSFTLRLLIDLGYRPELTDCVHCHCRLQPQNNTFSVRLGGILGPECRREDEVARPVSATAIKALRIMADQPLATAIRLAVTPALASELESIVAHYLQFHTGRPMRSSEFVKQAGE